MVYADFIVSLKDTVPPTDISAELKSLWYDKNGQWSAAHEIIQNLSGILPGRVHAYLHRKEGDIWNANYWYSRSDDKMPSISLNQEWELLALKFSD